MPTSGCDSPQTRASQILATGAYLPRRRVSGEELDLRLGLESGTTARLTGVRSRPVAESDETNSWMAAQACGEALSQAGLEPEDIQAIVYAGGIDEQPIPCTAALIQRELGSRFSGCACFDINATCLGFVVGLDTLSCMIEVGRYRHVLLVTADIASAGLDWSHLESAALFGDGAVAAVLGPTPSGIGSRILATRLETYGAEADACQIEGGGARLTAADYAPGPDGVDHRFLFQMNGRKVFRMASIHVKGFITRLLEGSGLEIRDFDLVIPHQASLSGLDLIQRRLGLEPTRFMTFVQTHGNMIASSIPLGLHLALQEGRIQRGSRILLLGTSAGFSIGGIALEF